jgi:hypothetical protein
MKSILTYLAMLFMFVFFSGCERLDQKADKVREFFRTPPVQPLQELIQTSVPVGFCAVAAMADQMGYTLPGGNIFQYGGNSVIHFKNKHEYPLSLLSIPCDDIYILRLQADEEICIISALFVKNESTSGQCRVYHISPVPVLFDEGNVKAIFVRNNVYVGDDLNLELKMSQGEIDLAIEKLGMPKPGDVSVAVEQNAWIIIVDPAGTWQVFGDDRYSISGGEQDISTYSNPAGNAASVLQMAMIGTTISPECLKNPVEGFAVLREISVETGTDSSLDDLVLGTIMYTFNESCNGRIKVQVATGSFVLSLGKEVEFYMMESGST